MYNLSGLNYLYSSLSDPWLVPFEKKMNVIFHARLNGKRTVVYLYENPDSSTFRYRGYNMCSTLKDSTRWGASYFFSYEIEMLKNYIDLIDVAVFIRYRWDETLNEFIELCKKKGISTAFDVDDLVFDIRYIHILLNSLGCDLSGESIYEHWFSYFSRLSMTGSMCGSCISTNDFLVEKLKEYFKKPGYVIPNFLNLEQKITSEVLRAEKNRVGFVKPFVIGYFSGSPSHKNDFELISGELESLLSKNNDISMKIAGYMDMPDNLKKYVKTRRIVKVPFRDFRELQKEIAEVDVNIVPLLDNIFTNCKSELKYFESAIVDTVTCASPTYAYSGAIEHGKNGYLCGQGDWYTVMDDSYKNGISQEIIKKARENSLLIYGPKEQLGKIENVLNSICNL